MQQNRGPEISPRIYSQLIFDKGAKNTQWGKNNPFSKQCWESWVSAYKTNKT